MPTSLISSGEKLIFGESRTQRADEGPACRDDEIDYYENLYWCALLFYFVGDPADVPLMWEAKHIDMDTDCGFDIQFMVGAGVDTTLKYLNERGHFEIAAYLSNMKSCKDFDDLPGWEQFRIGYFYPNRTSSTA